MSKVSYDQLKLAAKALAISIKGKKMEALELEIATKLQSMNSAALTKLAEKKELTKPKQAKIIKESTKPKLHKGFHPISGEPV